MPERDKPFFRQVAERMLDADTERHIAEQRAALELKPSLAEAHIALGEIYLAEDDLGRARQHAEFAARFGNPRLLEQMERYRR